MQPDRPVNYVYILETKDQSGVPVTFGLSAIAEHFRQVVRLE